MNNKLLNTWSALNDVYIYYINSEGKRKLKKSSSNWYFAIQKDDIKKANDILSNSRYSVYYAKSNKFPDFIKIYCQHSYDKNNKYRTTDVVLLLENNGIKTYEGDLSLARRWLIDKNPEIAVDYYTKLYFDIETDDTIGKIEIGRDRILSFAAIDNNGKEYFLKIDELTDGAEIKLLKQIAETFIKYDIVLGWNSSGFDIPYIKSRIRKLKVDIGNYYFWHQFAHIDLLTRLRHTMRFHTYLKSFSLNFIANHFLGKGKVSTDDQKIIDLYKNDLEKLREYNSEDSRLVKELDEKLGISDMMIKQSSWCNVPISSFGLYSIIDAYISRTAHFHNSFLPTSIKSISDKQTGKFGNNSAKTKKKQKYLGGMVLNSKTGLHKNVYAFDFKSLYPSIIRTMNIGHDTLRYEHTDDCITNPGTKYHKRITGKIKPTYFSKKDYSILNLSVSYLMEKRKEFKNIILKMIEDGQNKGKDWEKVRSDEIVVKELGNSLYGIQGLEYGRYYSPDIAESITLFGHWLLEFTEDFFEKLGHEIVAGDTDSVFVKCKGELNSNEVLNNFHKTLNKLLKDVYNVNECHIILEPDKTYDNLIILAKKAYIGHITHNEGKKVDDIYTRGIDYIKRDTLPIAGDIQKELINLIFKDSSIDYLKKWIHDTKLNFYNKKFTKDELKISHKVGKDLKDYTARTLPLHIRLAKEIYEKTGKNLKSTEIEYIVVGTEPLIQGVLYDDFKDGDPFDIDYYWSKKVAALLKRVLIKVYPDENWNELLMDFKTIKEKKEKERLKKEKEEEKERLKKEQMIKRENIKKERIAKNEEKERLKKEKAEKREKIKRERAAEKEKNKKGRTKKIQKKLLI